MDRRNFLFLNASTLGGLGVAFDAVLAQAAPAAVSTLPSKTMKSKAVLTLDDVKKIAAACEAEANAHRWLVSIAICDDGGHLLWLQRLDGAPPATAPIAVEKARTAALIRRPTKAFEDAINGGRIALMSTQALIGILEGGEPVVVDGQTIGSIGISGQRPPEDGQILQRGLRALDAR